MAMGLTPPWENMYRSHTAPGYQTMFGIAADASAKAAGAMAKGFGG
jgi:hypothetical protein